MSSALVLARLPFRSVLVATDFSPQAEAALRRAFRLRLASDACVHVLHVIDRPGTSPPEEQSVHLTMQSTLERVRGERDPRLVIPSLARGVPATEIDLLGRFTEAELIVVARRGFGGEPGLGSTTRELLETVDRPVLIVGQDAASETYSRALVALDLRLVSADLLVFASRLVDEAGTEVAVLHAFEASFEGTRGFGGQALNRWGERFQRHAQARLAEIVGALPENRIAWHSEVVLGDAAPAIAREASKRRADLVILGTQRRRGLARLLTGSVAMQVLESVDCDCLVLPTPGQERAFPPRPSLEPSQA